MKITTNMKLTPHFWIAEFKSPDTDEIPDEALKNLYRLANRLQVIRDLLGKPIVITSGYRSPEYNKKVGGAPNSYHLRGMAADIIMPNMPPKALQAYLKNWSGGMGEYGTWTHLDIREGKERW